MVLLIDNYDSFVYNLARYINLLDRQSCVFRNDKITIEDIKNINPAQIILSPGPRTPNKAGICLEVIETFHQTVPIMGICLGHQVIGQAFGGRVVRSQQPMHGKASKINHNGKGIMEGVPNNIQAGRYHSLVVDRPLPQCLEVTATVDNGEVMALRHKQLPIYGIQFHPESVMTEYGLQLLNNFLTQESIGDYDVVPNAHPQTLANVS